MELVVVSIISVMGFILGIVMLDRSYFKRLAWKRDFETEMFRLKKREGRKDKKLAAEIQVKPDKSVFELIKGLDTNKIRNVLDLVQGKDYTVDEEEQPDIVNKIIDIANNNPEMVQGFLQGLSKAKTGGQQENENLLFNP